MFSQALLSTLQAGLKFGFDIDPIITVHCYRSVEQVAIRSIQETTQLIRIFECRFPALHGILGGGK